MPRFNSRDGLSPRERKYAKIRAKQIVTDEENKTQAVRDAGYKAAKPSQEASKLEKKTDIQNKIESEVVRLQKKLNEDLSKESLIEKHKELLHAADPEGNPDYSTQQKALQDGYKLHRMPGFAQETQKHLHAHAHKVEFLDELAQKAEE